MKKLFILMVGIIFIFSMSALAGDYPKVKWGGMFYDYNFFHSNTDFDKKTDDGNSYAYIHADIQTSVDFGDGISVYTMIGAWGMHGMNPYWGCGCQGDVVDPSVRLLQGYLTIKNLFDTPFSFRIGKERLLYGDGAIFFDGGEDGAFGLKLMYNKPKIDFDLFFYRVAQSMGITRVGAATYGGYNAHYSDQYPGNINAFGGYAIFHATKNIDVHAYGVVRDQTVVKDSTNRPMWLGARLEATQGGLTGVVEYTMMAGQDQHEVDYKGFHLRGAVDYKLTDIANFGGYYLIFSGDDGDTGENELYESVLNGPYTNGFYKDWPGFGPAHLMTTGYGFSGVDPGNITATNLNVINGHFSKSLGALTFRFDFYNYTRNWVVGNGNDAMGNEYAIMLKYNYKNNLTIGATAGMWMPGDHIKLDWGLGDDADNAIGGYIWFAKTF